MTITTYQIGGDHASITDLASLGIPYPRGIFKPYQDIIILGDGQVRGVGGASATWHWDFLTPANRDALRLFCQTASTTVNMTTRINDADAFKEYTAVMIWPKEEARDYLRRIPFEIEFRNLVEYTP